MIDRTAQPLSRLAPFLIVLAGVYFFVRGPYRALTTAGDHQIMYAASLATLHGHNPYDSAELTRAWIEAGYDRASAPGTGGLPFLNPPSAVPFLLPFALVPWQFSKLLWAALHGAGLLLLCQSLLARRRDLSSPLRLSLFLALSLAFAPLQNAFGLGQPSLSVFLLVGFAFLQAEAGSDLAAGLLLGVATSLKPHLTILLLACCFATGRRRIATVALLVSFLMGGLTILWLQVHHLPWLASLRSGLALTRAPGAINDPGPSNPASATIIDLSVLFARLPVSSFVASLLAVIVTVVLVAILFRFRRPASSLLFFAAVCSISLLPLYHRNYDAIFLLFPLYWAFSEGWNADRPVAVILILLLGLFIVPGSKLLILAAGRLPPSLTHNWLWQMLFIHEAWLVLASSLLLLWTVHKRTVASEPLSAASTLAGEDVIPPEPAIQKSFASA